MDDQEQEMLEPSPQEKVELYDYLTNTLSLVILGGVEEVPEQSMFFNKEGRNEKVVAKYLKVKAVKKSSNNNNQSGQGMIKKKIKLELIDHDKEKGIPYQNQLAADGEDGEEEKGNKSMNKSERTQAPNRGQSTDRMGEESSRGMMDTHAGRDPKKQRGKSGNHRSCLHNFCC